MKQFKLNDFSKKKENMFFFYYYQNNEKFSIQDIERMKNDEKKLNYRF